MQNVITPARAAEIDRQMIETLGIPGLVLMEQAATAVADEAQALADGGKILVLCGKGNNGGDGWAAARILLTRGCKVAVGAVTTELTGDAAANALFFERTHGYTLLTEQTDFFRTHSDAAVIIDALFGTGLHREPAGICAELIRKINEHPAKVVSVDIPSGVFGADGYAKLAVHADVTVTFQYPKLGHFLFPGRTHTGRLVVKKIGIDRAAPSNTVHIDEYHLPPRPANSNKGTYGRLLLAAGSKGMAGAAVLSASAAVSAGAGLVTVLCTESTANVLQVSVPEAITHCCGTDRFTLDADLPRFTTLAIGPGLGQTEDIFELLKALLPLRAPKVLDADALNVIAAHPALLDLAENAVLTPHPAELSRLTSMTTESILRDPVKAATEFAAAHRVIVLLKGATTVVSDGTRTALITAGCPGMAKGGSGDVLTGVIGALSAQGMELFSAAATGAYFCGKAGERAYAERGIAMSPRDTVRNLRF